MTARLASLSVATAFALIVVACGADRPPADAGDAGGSTTSTAAVASGGGSSTTTGGSTASETPQDATAPAADPDGTAPDAGAGSPVDDAVRDPASGGAGESESSEVGQTGLEADLARACVRQGGFQTLTVVAEPGSPVAYASTYSDGTAPFDENYPGGSGSGFVDASGRFVERWTVGTGTPEGKVVVDIQAVSPDGATVGAAERSFEIVSVAGPCP